MTLTISFPADTEARLRDTAALTGKDVPTLVREAVEEKLVEAGEKSEKISSDLADAIDDSRILLSLRDEDDQLMVSSPTWDRAMGFLKSCVCGASALKGREIYIPAINPGPNGSIDLHWKTPEYEMLINIPANSDLPPEYYGDDKQGNSVKGTVVSGDNMGLLLWLTSRT